jgi:hypothetical protein
MKKLVVENDRLAVSHPVGDPARGEDGAPRGTVGTLPCSASAADALLLPKVHDGAWQAVN